MIWRSGIIFMGALMVGLSAVAQESVAPVNTTVASSVEVGKKSEAGDLYLQAVAERKKGQYKQAIQTAAKIVALYPQDEIWMPKAELLCAELYVDLGMLDSAEVTARQVQALHEGTEEAVKARDLGVKIKGLKKEAK